VLDACGGAVVRTIHVGEPPEAVAIDPGTDCVVVANRDEAGVSVLDARRGIVLRTLTVRAQPLAVAVDEQTSRAFVLHCSYSRLSWLWTDSYVHLTGTCYDDTQMVARSGNRSTLARSTHDPRRSGIAVCAQR
jgi:hypothetical protein